MHIIAFGASNSRQSINQTFAASAASLVRGASVEILDLNDYEMPIFSEDRERRDGQPEAARRFLDRIAAADALVISYAEHNGSFSAAYKNLVDWASRIERRVFQDKPTLMLATSPGPGGGAQVLAQAEVLASFFGAQLVASLPLPRFQQNFDASASRVTDPVMAAELDAAVQRLIDRVAAAGPSGKHQAA